MNAARLKQIEEIYHIAVDSSPDLREAFLNKECGGDDELLEEVRSLLSYDDISDSIIDSSPDAIAAEMFADEAETEFIGKTIGHYRIERLIGEGGMGKVYLADDLLLGRKVALKILPEGVFEHRDRLKRFKQEAKAASGLNHPNILTIHEFGTDEDFNYIVTEYIDGTTLREKLRKRLSLIETLDIAAQTASALAAAHNAGIVHRDIKPENIMIRSDGILKVLDFGLAKLSMPASGTNAGAEDATMFRTEPGTVMGTTNYMSPEQARGVAIDARTDIWSLGVIIYEMATRKIPFAGATPADTLVAILNQPIEMIDTFDADAPAELKRIIERTLAKNADERYRNIEELASELKHLHQRLVYEKALAQTHGAAHITDKDSRAGETSTRIMPPAGAQNAQESDVPQRLKASDDQSVKPRNLALTIAVVLAAVVIIGVVIWQLAGPLRVSDQKSVASPAAPAVPVQPAVAAPVMTYSLTVQSFTDGRYKEPFVLSGEMLFRNRDRIRLNIKAGRSGFLYIVNEGPKSASGDRSYNILFPSPMTNAGSAQLSAGQEIPIPAQSWFELDAKEGTEQVWLIWSANTLPELESAKRFANPEDRGRIKDAGLVRSIASILDRNQASRSAVERDDNKKESQITGSGDIVAHLIKLEHH